MTDDIRQVDSTVVLELTVSEAETVVEALRLLLATLRRADGEQVTEVQGLIERLGQRP
jgi:hypothetical protein